MSNRTRMALGLAGGYLLGRRRKAGWLLAAVGLVASRAVGAAISRQGATALESSPELKELAEQTRRTAMALAGGRIRRLTERVHATTEALRPSPPREKPEPKEQQPGGEEPAGGEEQPKGEEPAEGEQRSEAQEKPAEEEPTQAEPAQEKPAEEKPGPDGGDAQPAERKPKSRANSGARNGGARAKAGAGGEAPSGGGQRTRVTGRPRGRR